MSTNKRFTVKYRRRREGTTNYRKRLKLLLANKPRLIVRKTNNNTIVQIAEYSPKGDKILMASTTRTLSKFGWDLHRGNIPSAYLIGLLVGKKAKQKGINEIVIDIGLNKPIKGSRVYAVLKGAIDSGLKIHHSDDILPNEDKIKGKNIENFRKIEVIKKFEQIKNKIMSE